MSSKRSVVLYAAEMANSVESSKPPRENSREHRTIDVVHGRGTTALAQCIMFGTWRYRQTGLLQAYAARSLIHTPLHKSGYASPCTAFRHKELSKALESDGLSRARVST